MYSHNMVGANDIEAAKKFYDATFQAIGGKPRWMRSSEIVAGQTMKATCSSVTAKS